MKHFNFKTLAMGAALAGSLFTTSAYAQDDLGLKDVNIVTLQWNGGGRYAGINGGTGWDNQGSNNGGTFSGPNGGNGRIGLISKGDGTYAIATQGIFLTVDANGNKGNAFSLEDATGFTVTKSTEGELKFKSPSGHYLTDRNFTTKTSTGDADGYKMNSFDNYAYAKQDFQKVNDDLHIAAICLPFKVQKPVIEGVDNHFYTFTVVGSEIVTTEVTEVGAGVPFLHVSDTDNDNVERLVIPQENQAYVTAPSSESLLSGFFIPTSSHVGYHIRINNNVFEFSPEANAADTDRAYITESTANQLGATSFYWDAANNKLVAVLDPTPLINEAVAIVAQLNDMKSNEGTASGQYNVTEEAVGAEGLAIWNALDDYDAADDAVYTDMTVNEAKTLLEQLTALRASVWGSNVHGLGNVEIVTLQWPGKRTVGFNGGERTWAAPYSMGSPNNANARVAIVKRTDGKYAVACQGLFAKVTGQGNTLSDERITDPNKATGFNVIRSSENGLTFVTDDGWYLYHPNTDMQATNDESLITADFQLNTFGDYAIAKEDIYQVADGLWMSAVCVPFKVSMPEGDDYHAYSVTIEDGEVVTTELTGNIDAGVPFIVVSPAGSQIYLNIPQENQAYAAPSTTTAMKGWYQFYGNGANDATKNYYLDVRFGQLGFYTDANPNRKVNQAAISGAAVQNLTKQYATAAFVWNATENKLEITQAHKVTYKVFYDGKEMKNVTAITPNGLKPSIPASFAAAFTTLEFADGTPETITEDVTISVIAKMNAPFEVSTSIDNAHWYNLGIRGEHWIRVHDREPYQPIIWADVTNNELFSDAYQWAFMGNPYELYIYNKSTGEHTLGVVNDDYVKMLNGQTAWTLLEQGADGFVLRAPGTTNWYLNQNGGSGNNRDLKLWKDNGGRNDSGSTFKVYEVPSQCKLTINGWASLYLDYNAAIPAGVNAYYVSAVNGGYATLTQIEGAIPANTAVLLEGTGEYTFEYAAEASTIEGNQLKGTTTDAYIEGSAYVLANGSKGIGLYKATLNKDATGATGTTHFKNNANKAYLPVTSASAPMLSFERGEGTTSIESIVNGQQSTVIYDLLGRRVQNMEKGIYIVNGKKVVK